MSEPYYKFKSKLPKSVMIWNFKGGVAKSSSTVCLAAALNSVLHYNVCIIDTDPQCNTTMFFDQGRQNCEHPEDLLPITGTLKDYIDAGGEMHACDIKRTFTFSRTPGNNGEKDFFFTTEESMAESIPAPKTIKSVTRACTISLVPGDTDIASVNLDDPGVVQKLIDEINGESPEDTIILIDTPPQITNPLSAAIYGAKYVLTPIMASSDSIAGLEKVVATINEAREAGYNIELLGFLVCNFMTREAVPKEILEALRQALLGDDTPYLFNSVIRHNAYMERNRSIGIPCTVSQSGFSDLPMDYLNAAIEMINRIKELEEE